MEVDKLEREGQEKGQVEGEVQETGQRKHEWTTTSCPGQGRPMVETPWRTTSWSARARRRARVSVRARRRAKWREMHCDHPVSSFWK